MKLIKKYLLYLFRWQLSTPILAIVPRILSRSPKIDWKSAIVSNLIGGLIFFWIDRWIFKDKNK